MLRSTRFAFQIVFAALALGAGAEAGCAAVTTSADSEPPAAALQDQGSNSGFAPKPVEDAAPLKSSPYRGNPLCHPESGYCVPDDEMACLVTPPSPSDGGAAGDGATKGCRIKGIQGGSVAPQCPDATRSGGDGTSCQVGEDCAPGLDCVASDMGTKACRHYCCGGTCKGNLSNGSATFCDVQTLTDVSQKAPVCMPLKRCNKLLGVGECGANETCTVVTEGGDTGCVVVGDKQVGDSCDDAHCGAKLACLGQPGARRCLKLCKVSASECPAAQTCVTSAAFKDPGFGICQ